MNAASHVTQPVRCRCGSFTLRVEGPPILSAACYCRSCQRAAAELAPSDTEALCDRDGGTHFVLYRKDRVDWAGTAERLVEHRLTPESGTRRVLAACCHTPIFLEFQAGHWVSIYSSRLAESARPPLDLRTMTRDAPEGVTFSDGVPSPATHNLRFMARLFWAWARMGFRSPTIDVEGGDTPARTLGA